MAKAKTIFHLLGKPYEVKEQIRANVRKIASESLIDVPLKGRWFAFMRDLFAYHPHAEYKIGNGIEEIVVRPARNPKYREFWVRTAGSDEWIDVSWTEC